MTKPTLKEIILLIAVIILIWVNIGTRRNYKSIRQEKRGIERTNDSLRQVAKNLELIRTWEAKKRKEEKRKDSILIVSLKQLHTQDSILIKKQQKVIGSYNKLSNDELLKDIKDKFNSDRASSFLH